MKCVQIDKEICVSWVHNVKLKISLLKPIKKCKSYLTHNNQLPEMQAVLANGLQFSFN